MDGLKELIVVLTIAASVLWFGRRFAIQYISVATYDRRMYGWLAMTIAAFLAPNFWLYALVAVPVLVYMGQRDDNPHALLLLFFYVIPPLSIEIPAIGINKIFDISQARLLSIVLLIPIMLRTTRQQGREVARWQFPDIMVVLYCLLQLVLLVPYEDPTNTVRRLLLQFIDTIVVIYTMSRIPADRHKFIDLFISFSLVCCIFGLVGLFETTRNWLMYQQLNARWGDTNIHAWLFRGDSLRAQASAGHSLTLGIVLVVGLAFSMYAMRVDTRRWSKWIVFLVLCVGLISTHSRGPWLCGGLVLILVQLMSAGNASVALRRIGWIALLAIAVLVTPVGDSVVQKLPFIGEKDFNVEYRERLIDVSMNLVWINPWFGDPFVMRNMEELRQGQGIIDIVNAYLAVALFNGITGLVLYASLFAIAMWRGLSAWWRSRAVDDDLTLIMSILLAMMAAILVLLGTSGMIGLQYALTGLLLSAVRLQPMVLRPKPVYSPAFRRAPPTATSTAKSI